MTTSQFTEMMNELRAIRAAIENLAPADEFAESQANIDAFLEAFSE